MTDVTRDVVLAALKTIKDPRTGKDIVSAGLAQGVVAKGPHVGFTLEIDPAHAKVMEPVRKQAEEAVKAIPGVLSVTGVMTAHSDAPSGSSPRQPEVKAGTAALNNAQGIPGVGHIVAVASGKGGVGKSTVAANLALALSGLGLKVGLLDADVYGPSVPRLLNLSGKPTSADGKRIAPKKAFGIKAMSMGLMVDEDTAMIWRGPMVMSALTQMLMDVDWAPLDVLVVDMPPGTGDAQLTMAQRVPLSGAVIVSTPQDLALIDAKKAIAMFKKVEVPILGLIENMSVHVCSQCGHEEHIFGHGGAAREAERQGADLLGELPLDLEIRTASDDGTPIVALKPDSPHAIRFTQIAQQVAAKLSGAAKPAPKIVMD